MEYTENYKLAKPKGALKFDPDYDNGNYDIIDAEIKKNADAIGDIATLLDTINGEVI